MALIKCPECQKEISDSAPTCPNCGKVMHTTAQSQVVINSPVAPPKKKRRLWLWALIILLLFGVIGSMNNDTSNNDSEPATTSNSSTAAITVTATALTKEYDDNEIAADQKYKGKTVQITASVKDIGKDILNEPYITFSDGKEFSLGGVQCYFKRDERDKIGSLKKGQKITIQGVVDGLMMNVQLKNCVFVVL
jgi:hypothetical protein